MPAAAAPYLPYVVTFNFFLVGAALVVLGKITTARPLKEVPDGAQNAAELVLGWFVERARQIDARRVTLIAPFLATLFFMILFSNLLAILPIPLLRIPPTSYFSVPLALALIAVLGVVALAVRIDGAFATLKHTVWPNPLQLVGDASHALSLSLRLYGNIGGEYLVAVLATQAAPYGIPLVIHALGLIPATVQPMVFTLLTADFLSTALVARRTHDAGAPATASPSPQPGNSVALMGAR